MKRIPPILLILLFAFALRLINIDGRSLWYDEAFAVLFAEKGLDAMLYGTLEPVAGGASDIHPLLYYGTLNGWMRVLGQSTIVLRLWSVLQGVATIYVLYRIGRELFSERAGLAVAFITAIAPFHVQYSQEIRMYSLLVLLLMLATWCYIRTWKDTRWRWWVLFGVFAGLAMYTQQLAAFYLLAIGLVPLLLRQKRQIVGMGVGTVVALMVYFPWLVNIPSQLEKVNSYYWVAKPGIVNFLTTLRSFFSVNLDISPTAAMLAMIGALFIVIFLVVQLVFYLRKPRRKAESDRLGILFVCWMFAAPIGLMWLVSQVQPVYLERSLIGSALMLYLALGWMFTRSGLPRILVVVLGGLGILLAAVGLYYQYTFDTFPNSPFREAIETIHSEAQAGDVVVHMHKLTMLPMSYYDRDLTQRYIGDRPGSPEDTLALPTQEALQLIADDCIQAASRDAQRVWFVTFERAEREYAAAGLDDLQDAFDWLDEHYMLDERLTFNDLNVYRYHDPIRTTSFECAA